MQEPKKTSGNFWQAGLEATRVLLVPFDAGLSWLLALALILLPAAVDRLIGFGVILAPGAYRIAGVVCAAAAVWQTLLLLKRAFRPTTFAVASFGGAAAACVIALALSVYRAPLRPAFQVILWVVVLYLLAQSVWFALLSWGMASEEDPEIDSPVVAPSGTAAPRLEAGTPNNAGTLCMAVMTAPSDRAEVIARRIVDERLAACAQVPGEMTSYFWWQGEVNRERERLLFLKTRTDLVPALRELIAEIHPAEVPELLVLPIIDGLPAYLLWMEQELRPRVSSDPVTRQTPDSANDVAGSEEGAVQ
ncbi:MAG TPA: divalent-cation tolerance protein CutA [Spirochaetia bacterium]|nr:divalent-cation tolerance protein CutA [Spirochaetia bacterium]